MGNNQSQQITKNQSKQQQFSSKYKQPYPQQYKNQVQDKKLPNQISINIQKQKQKRSNRTGHHLLEIQKIQQQIKQLKLAYELSKQKYECKRGQLSEKVNRLLPILVRAQQAVNSLQFTNVVDIKSSKKLPQLLSLNLDALAILFHLRLNPIYYIPEIQITKNITIPFWKNSYEESGKYIIGPNFDLNKNLNNFNKDAINGETIQLLQPLLIDGSFWYNQTQLAKISKAACGICSWIYAMFNYYHKSEPLRKQKLSLVLLQFQVNQKLEKLIQKEKELLKYDQIC